MIQLESVVNLTTGATVVLSRPRTSGCVLVSLIVLLALTALFVLAIVISLLAGS